MASLVAGLNAWQRLNAAAMPSRAGARLEKISSALEVGSITRPERMNSGSSNIWRKRPRALLMVGCPRKSFSPTRLTLRSCIIDSKTTSRLMSARRRSFLFIMGTARRQGLRSWEVGVPSRPPFNNPEQRCAVCEQVMPSTGKRMSYLRSAHSSMGVPFHT
ncbi:hypothetical protein D3C73_1038990 [compost metagenome]